MPEAHREEAARGAANDSGAEIDPGRRDEARDLFGQMLARRTRAGLLSEDCDLSTGAPWGNYPQTYSLAGLINCAVLLSNPWSSVR